MQNAKRPVIFQPFTSLAQRRVEVSIFPRLPELQRTVQPGRYAPPCASTNVYEEWVSMTLPDVPSECSVRTTSHTFASAAGASSDGKSPAKTAPNRMSKQPPYASLSRRMQFLVYGISTRLPRPTGPNSTPRRSAGPKQLPSPLAVCTRVRLHAPKTVRQKSQYNYKPQQSQACPFHIEPPWFAPRSAKHAYRRSS